MAAPYKANHAARYRVPSLLNQIEVAAVTAAQIIFHEDPATPDHPNRLKWANFVNKSSPTVVAWFAWPVSMDQVILAALQGDNSGGTVKDIDVQRVVDALLNQAIADFIANPPQGTTGGVL